MYSASKHSCVIVVVDLVTRKGFVLIVAQVHHVVFRATSVEQLQTVAKLRWAEEEILTVVSC